MSLFATSLEQLLCLKWNDRKHIFGINFIKQLHPLSFEVNGIHQNKSFKGGRMGRSDKVSL